MTQYGFYLDQSICLGCFACQMACKDWYDTETTAYRQVRAVEEGHFPATRLSFVSTACMHCENPPCVQVCPVSAITKRPDGIVVQDPTTCIGCRYCSWACPYNAPKFIPERGRVEKCNLCVDRLSAGQEPICVAACITRALQWGDIAELEERASATRQVPGLPDPNITKPAMIVTPPKERIKPSRFS